MPDSFYTMEPIAHVRSPFSGKFGVPRQSGLVEELESTVVFQPPYRNRDALRGLDGFSHIWLIWVFHYALGERDGGPKRSGSPERSGGPIEDGNPMDSGNRSMRDRETPSARWSPTVRPPRLGGNARLGVFATRSPFRPNPIGLSCVRLDRIADSPEGPVLYIRGADLADGTPVLDIKPYVPYADCHPDALGGFAADAPAPCLDVEIPPDLLERIPEGEREALRGALALDPRPRYIQQPERVYGFGFAGREVRFSVDGKRLIVREIV